MVVEGYVVKKYFVAVITFVTLMTVIFFIELKMKIVSNHPWESHLDMLMEFSWI